MLVELREDVRIEERHLRGSRIAGVKLADVAEPGVIGQLLAEVVILRHKLEIRVSLPTLCRKPDEWRGKVPPATSRPG